MHQVKICQVCKSEYIEEFLLLKDYFLTQETFSIAQCHTCGFKFTTPEPDGKELGAYYDSPDYVSHSGNKQGLVNKIYHIVKHYALSRKFLLISKRSAKGKILDIGCATGDFLSLFKKTGWSVLGIEPNEGARAVAMEKHGISSFDESYLSGVEEKSIDVVTMWHVLEHVPDLHARVQDIKRILKNTGLLVVAVPNPDSFDAHYYNEYWAGYDVPRHLHHFSKSNISELFSLYGFEVTETLPMKFDSYYVSLLSEKYKTGKSNLWRAFFVGWQSNIKAMASTNYSSLIYVLKIKNY